MFVLFFFFFIFIGLPLSYVAFRLDKARYYALAGGCFYVVSFLASFSIGLYLLAIPAVLWALAVRAAIALIRGRITRRWTAIAALAVWLAAILLVDEEWLFYPIRWMA